MNKRQTFLTITIAAVAIAVALTLVVAPLSAAKKTTVAAGPTEKETVARGEYLVTIGGCNDCHTPLKLGPNGPEPDMDRMLSGHPQELVMPESPKMSGPWGYAGSHTNTAFSGPWGVSYTKNLTPEPLTGIGIWSEEMFMKTIRSGRHWGVGRPILPPMPWFNYAKMSDDDLRAVYRYLRTIKPIKNEVPDAIVAPPPAPAG